MKPTIADIFHYAADHCLWDGRVSNSLHYFSCFALSEAIKEFAGHHPGTRSFDAYDSIICIGLSELGLDCNSVGAFREFTTNPARQGARYAWLKFCAMLAEEQGV